MRIVQLKIAPPQGHGSEETELEYKNSMCLVVPRWIFGRMTLADENPSQMHGYEKAHAELEYKTVSKRTCPGEFSDAYCAAENCSHAGAWE